MSCQEATGRNLLYMGPVRPVCGLYGAGALICRPMRGKVSLQWPSKGPDVDLAARSLPGRRCLAGRLLGTSRSLLYGPCEACGATVTVTLQLQSHLGVI